MNGSIFLLLILDNQNVGLFNYVFHDKMLSNPVFVLFLTLITQPAPTGNTDNLIDDDIINPKTLFAVSDSKIYDTRSKYLLSSSCVFFRYPICISRLMPQGPTNIIQTKLVNILFIPLPSAHPQHKICLLSVCISCFNYWSSFIRTHKLVTFNPSFFLHLLDYQISQQIFLVYVWLAFPSPLERLGSVSLDSSSDVLHIFLTHCQHMSSFKYTSHSTTRTIS